MIENVKLQNIKGFTGSYAFTHLTAITGDNSTGKSAILDALQLGTTGQHVRFKKTNGELFKMCSSNQMSVSVEVDGFRNFFEIKRSKGGTVSRNEVINNKYNPLLFDSRRFFSLPQHERKLTVLQAYGVPSVSEAVQLVTEELEKKQDEEVKQVVLELHEIPLGSDPISNLQSLWKWSKDGHSDATVTIRKQTEAMQGLLESESEQVTYNSPKLQEEIRNANSRIAEISLKQQRAEACDADEMERISKEMDRLKLSMLDETAFEALKKKHAQHSALYDKTAPSQEQLESMDAMQQLIEENTRQLNSDSMDVESVKEEIEHARQQIEDIGETAKCPHCYSSGRKVAKQLKADWEKKVTEGEQHLQVLADRIKKNRETIRNTGVELAKLEAICAAANAAMANVQATTKLIDEDLNTLEKYEILEAKYNAATKDHITYAQIVELMEQRAELNNELLELEAKQAKNSEAKGRREQATRCQKEIDSQERKREYYETAITTITKWQDATIAEAYKGFCGDVDTVLKACYPQRSALFIDGEIWIKNEENGTQYAFEAFSGTEEAIVFAGLSLALTKGQSPIVIIDELPRLQPERRRLFADAMAKLVEAGKVTQVILVDYAWQDSSGKWSTITP